MNDDELIINLNYLIDKYISDNQKEDFYSYMKMELIPVKGILADLNKYKIKDFNKKDGELIKNIYFFYC